MKTSGLIVVGLCLVLITPVFAQAPQPSASGPQLAFMAAQPNNQGQGAAGTPEWWAAVQGKS